ncbi:MAG: hypothetical protein WCK67_07960 [bacterium]
MRDLNIQEAVYELELLLYLTPKEQENWNSYVAHVKKMTGKEMKKGLFSKEDKTRSENKVIISDEMDYYKPNFVMDNQEIVVLKTNKRPENYKPNFILMQKINQRKKVERLEKIQAEIKQFLQEVHQVKTKLNLMFIEAFENLENGTL